MESIAHMSAWKTAILCSTNGFPCVIAPVFSTPEFSAPLSVPISSLNQRSFSSIGYGMAGNCSIS